MPDTHQNAKPFEMNRVVELPSVISNKCAVTPARHQNVLT